MNNQTYASSDEKVASFAISGHTVQMEENGEYVSKLFNNSEDLEGIVVLKNNTPVGLIMRTYFFQKLSTPYGNSLYSKRPVSFLMETSIVTVDYNDDIDEISKLVTGRTYGNLYDYIIVTKDSNYYGVISIRQFLVALSDRNKKQLSELKLQHEKELQLINSLCEKTQSIRNLLDNAGQGFLSFGEDLMVKSEYSSECCKIFDTEVSLKSYSELMGPHLDDNKKEILCSVFKSYFSNNDCITDSAYLSLLPAEIIINGRNILFEYKSIPGISGKDIMVILTDITEKTEMEKALEKDRENQRLIVKSILCKNEIIQLMNDFNDALLQSFGLYESKQNIYEFSLYLFRAIHTFKGDFAQYSFCNTMRALHTFENKIQDMLDSSDIRIDKLQKIIADIKSGDVLKEDIYMAEASLGKGYFAESKDITISEDRMHLVMENIFEIISESEKDLVLKEFKKLTHKNLKSILLKYQDYISYLSGRLGKGQPEYIVSGDSIYIDNDKYGSVIKNLIHLFRNSVDHGLETEEERLILGKNPNGTLKCEIRSEKDSFSIEISDDGQGIDLNKIKEKVLEKGIFSKAEIEKMDKKASLDLIFLDNLSTKDSISQVSGRGMGLSSLKNECVKLGGKISVESEMSKGTLFIITLPCL